MFMQSTGPGQAIPPGTPPSSAPLFAYTLTATPMGNKLQFTLVRDAGTPLPPAGTNDHALDMRVLKTGGRIQLTLDSAVDWYFPKKNAIQLMSSTGENIPDITERYIDLQPSNWPAKCQKLSFYAYSTVDPNDPDRIIVNTDRINILVVLNQFKRDNATLSDEPLYLLIDPGIKNPGDDP
jgi:hypothetical protein